MHANGSCCFPLLASSVVADGNSQRAIPEEVSYFRNKEYPMSGSTQEMRLLTIPVMNSNIGQIRWAWEGK